MPANYDGQANSGADLTDNPVALNFGQESAVESIQLTPAVQLPAGGVNGAITPANVQTQDASEPFSSGLRNFSLTWSEVGILSLSARLDDYLGISGLNVIGGTRDNIGRFYPASFIMNTDSTSYGCGNFAYMDQNSINLTYEIEAHRDGGGITLNYRGDFAMADILLVAEDNNSGTNLGGRLSGFSEDVTGVDWGNDGILSINESGNFSRLATPDGSYPDLIIGIQVLDNDADADIPLESLDMNADESTTCDDPLIDNCSAKQIGSGELDVRFGILHLDNAFGPEASDLNVNVSTRYFDGTRFITNTDDNCTSLNLANYTAIVSSWTDNLEDGETLPILLTNIINGEGSITMQASGIGNDGSVQFEYATPAWLDSENDDGDFDDDPFSTITFGQFRGTDRIIYWREIIQ